MAYETKARKATEMLDLMRSGRTVWWRREDFHQTPFRGNEPKWHVLTGRLDHGDDASIDADGHAVWTALCGYRRDFAEKWALLFPSLRKSAPTVSTRCRYCVVGLEATKTTASD